MRPFGDLDQRIPENLLGQVGADDVDAGHDQRVEPLRADLLEALVVAIDVRARGRRTRQRVERERVDEKLRDRVALADQAQKLALGRLERGVRHHVEQADVQLADILPERGARRQHAQAVALELGEGR